LHYLRLFVSINPLHCCVAWWLRANS